MTSKTDKVEEKKDKVGQITRAREVGKITIVQEKKDKVGQITRANLVLQ